MSDHDPQGDTPAGAPGRGRRAALVVALGVGVVVAVIAGALVVRNSDRSESGPPPAATVGAPRLGSPEGSGPVDLPAEIWRRSLDGAGRGFGFGPNPETDGTHLYLATSEAVMALDIESGEILWHREVPAADPLVAFGGVPLGILWLGGDDLAVSGASLHVADTATGEDRWTLDLPTPDTFLDPTQVTEDHLVISWTSQIHPESVDYQMTSILIDRHQGRVLRPARDGHVIILCANNTMVEGPDPMYTRSDALVTIEARDPANNGLRWKAEVARNGWGYCDHRHIPVSSSPGLNTFDLRRLDDGAITAVIERPLELAAGQTSAVLMDELVMLMPAKAQSSYSVHRRDTGELITVLKQYTVRSTLDRGRLLLVGYDRSSMTFAILDTEFGTMTEWQPSVATRGRESTATGDDLIFVADGRQWIAAYDPTDLSERWFLPLSIGGQDPAWGRDEVPRLRVVDDVLLVVHGGGVVAYR